jgi:hypothetical protein
MSLAEEKALVHQLDPLLRELIAFGLVERAPGDGEPRWELTDAAQHRLTALHKPAPASGSMFFVGHRCDRCRDHTVTRLVDGAHLCARCQGDAAVDTTPPGGVPAQRPA